MKCSVLQSMEKSQLRAPGLSEKERLNEHRVFSNVDLECIGCPSPDGLYDGGRNAIFCEGSCTSCSE